MDFGSVPNREFLNKADDEYGINQSVMSSQRSTEKTRPGRLSDA